jgi:hypothetical protein
MIKTKKERKKEKKTKKETKGILRKWGTKRKRR